MIKLTERERGYIKSAACFGGDQIDKVVASIQRENPDAFWKESDRNKRNFFDEPVSMGGFILPHNSHVQRYKPRSLK